MDISSLLEVEVKEGKASDLPNNAIDSNDLVTRKRVFPSEAISHDEKHFYKLMFGADIASVRFRKLHCTSCDLHIGSAPADAHNMHEHPVLHVLLCTSCRNFYGDGTFEQGDDATDMFCRWCANGGNLYCCSYCSNTFCYNCIKRNFDPMVRKKIERDEKWKCFVCNPADLYTARASCWALLQHVQTVTRILQSDRKMSPKEIEAKMNLDESQCCPHRKKRKRSETLSDDEDEDETYGVSKKRRRVSSGRRRRRVFKQETVDSGPQETGKSSCEGEAEGNRITDDLYYVDSRKSRETENAGKDRRGKPSPDEVPLALRQRNRRGQEESNDVGNFDHDDIPAPLLQCDQTMIEGAESLTFDGSQPKQQQMAPRVIGISPVPTVNLLKRPGITVGPLTRGGKTGHRLVRGITGTPVLVRKISPANIHVNSASSSLQAVPMVTIPSRNHMQQNAIRPTLGQSAVARTETPSVVESPNSTRTRAQTVGKSANSPSSTGKNAKNVPSVIDLDSDSDEPVVLVAPSQNWQNSNDRVPGVSTVTYPVRPDDGLMMIVPATPKNRDDVDEDEDEIVDSSTDVQAKKNFDQIMRNPTKNLDTVLDSLRAKLKKVVESAVAYSPDKELLAAKAKTRAVNRTIKRTVAELTSLNDDLMRAYQNYKRDRTKDSAESTDTIVLEKRQKSSCVTPLDMECTRESEPELDNALDEDLDDDDSNDENSQSFAFLREIRPFKRRVHRAVEARPQTRNKSVQVDEIVFRDCESSIGYTLLLKADYDSQRQRDILRPVVVPDENFGKYEEEFINYLQYIEDHGILTEEDKDSSTEKIVSINELLEADLADKINDNTSIDASVRNVIEEETRDDALIDENVEIFEEHLEILTTKSVDSESETSENLDFNSTTSNRTGDKINHHKSDENKDETESNAQEKSTETTETTSRTTTTSTTTTTAATIQTNVEYDKSTKAITNSTRKKVVESTIDEETVLAVRALIEDDDENGSNAEILKNWKPVDSDDECTILD